MSLWAVHVDVYVGVEDVGVAENGLMAVVEAAAEKDRAAPGSAVEFGVGVAVDWSAVAAAVGLRASEPTEYTNARRRPAASYCAHSGRTGYRCC